jgi:C4-dicarboxylate-specific signal transduction histidine kinase
VERLRRLTADNSSQQARREASESALRQLNDQLEERIAERTSELSRANELMNAMGDLVISKPYLRAELADMVRKVFERRPGGVV